MGDPAPSAAELAVLNDLGSRLTSIHAPDEVLRRVAVETRRLLGVDVAYIMLARADGVLRIEVAEGTLGNALDGIEVPRGVGLGGLIMQTGEPRWSADYLTDGELEHARAIDAAAAGERLGGIIGVPLRVAGRAIGVLFAAARGPRPFADREVVLLSSLATHAAVAIHNARLFERYQRATDALSRSVDLHERLVRIATGGGGPAEIVTALADALGAEVVFLPTARHDGRTGRAERHGGQAVPADPRGQAVPPVSRGQAVPSPPHERAVPSASYEQVSRGQTVHPVPRGRAVPVLVGEEPVGELVVSGADPPAHLVETGATVLALAIATERAVAEAERRARGELVAALFGGRLDEATARRRAALAGVDLDHTGCVAVLSPPAPEVAERLCRDGGWAAEHDGHSVVLLPAHDAVVVRARLLALAPGIPAAAVAPATGRAGGGHASGDEHADRHAEDDGHADSRHAGGGHAGGGPAGVRRAYEEAVGCVALLRALGRSGCALPDELGVYRVLLRQAGSGELERFVTATVGPLLAHRRSGDLVTTAETYLDRFRHHAHTCAALHIHPNTLYKRLRRVTELLGPGWDGPGRALETRLALRLHRLGRAPGSTG
ncbi:helix-turn-helix domain-containing protein [Planobispora takensis]|uniref:helix-turn-helix domain-containing protein n=1 Tax=Planobispora takensis TaxID=1367882 RepID=UPI00194570BA|nr:GAF domain-containing protein [Planobispora takensis]